MREPHANVRICSADFASEYHVSNISGCGYARDILRTRSIVAGRFSGMSKIGNVRGSVL